MTHRVGAKGQVVIPKQIRDELGLVPGVEVSFTSTDGGVELKPFEDRLRRGRYSGSGMAAKLLEYRCSERE
jgi:AbrB family looped-hinge helix DNA binding protein